MSIHDHLKFYNSSSSSNNNDAISGGLDLVPTLNIDHNAAPNNVRNKTLAEKQMEIVEYLKKIAPRDLMASFVDVKRELRIDLREEIQVLEMLKSNPMIDQMVHEDGILYFQYRAKFNLKNKVELVNAITRVRNGIVLEDIKNCYPDIESDVMTLLVGGTIIAGKNKEKRSLVLYPRGEKFVSKLFAQVTAVPGQQTIQTSASLLQEVHRGEAVMVGTTWYRVDSAIGSGLESQQNQRSAAPPSVTLDKPLSDKNVYHIQYTAKELPLDGDFDGTEAYTGPIYKHGCTNDLKELWRKTADDLKSFEKDDAALHRELVRLNLLSKSLTTVEAGSSRRTNKGKVKKRQTRKPRAGNSTAGTNPHLRGTQLERVLKESYEKTLKQEERSRGN